MIKSKTKEAAEENQSNETQPVFDTRIVFIKESHLTSPESPHVFQKKQQYHNKFEIAVSFNELEDNVHEVSLKLTVNAYPKEESKEGADPAGEMNSEIDPDEVPVYTGIVQQAGVFIIKGFDEVQSARIKKITCAEILFPFARAHIMNLVVHAGFPPVYLAPINFNAVNAQVEEKQDSQKKESVRH